MTEPEKKYKLKKWKFTQRSNVKIEIKTLGMGFYIIRL